MSARRDPGRCFDVAVVGAGFAGSLTALLLQRCGFSTVLLERSRHPRFAIGESSTPIADLVLRDLARRYRCPELETLSRYGTWKERLPEVVCGAKQGFSYFWHEPGRDYQGGERPQQLLVAASSALAVADTHWLRADVDHYLARLAQQYGAVLFEEVAVEGMLAGVPDGDGWRLAVRPRNTAGNNPVELRARFVIDASGPGGAVSRWLGLEPAPCGDPRAGLAARPRTDMRPDMRTDTRAIFAHVEGLRSWREMLVERGVDVDEHPFDCDRSALHQFFAGGWFWQLRFDDGTASVGLVLDNRRHPPSEESPEQEWRSWLHRFPTLVRQFEHAEVVRPRQGFVRTERVQRRAAVLHGARWAMLPHTAGFVDPLHSTGIAHSILGVERLVGIVAAGLESAELEQRLADYGGLVTRELDLVDLLVATCYDAAFDFETLVVATMAYFVAAVCSEEGRQRSQLGAGSALLLADDQELVGVAGRIADLIGGRRTGAGSDGGDGSIAVLEREVRELLAPFNTVGLLDPGVRNLYRYTVAE